MPLLLLPKTETVQHPGSRGGHPWLDEHGQWRYGPHLSPTAIKTAATAAPTRRVAPHPKSPAGYRAAAQALSENATRIADTATTPIEWRQHQLARLGEQPTSTRKVGPAPTRALEWSQDGGRGVRQMYESMPATVRNAALDGLQHVEENVRLAHDHALTPRAVLLHFIWAMLSRSVSPYKQESAYVDLEHSGINYFVDKALQGKFDLSEYKSWLGESDKNVLISDATSKGYIQRPPGDAKKFKGLSEGSPGRGAMDNVNSVGALLDRWSKLGTKPLTDIYTNPDISGQEARREFWKLGYGGVGINNKILSFATAMLGKPDVMVMDIWQARNFHPEAFERHWQREHEKIVAANGGIETDRNKDQSMTKATVKIIRPYNSPGGPAGLAAYEGLEALLAKALKGLPVDKNGLIEGGITPSIFALHWLSWVAAQNAIVGHHSLDTVQNMDKEGLSSRPQQRITGPGGIPTADDILSQLAITSVTEGDSRTRNFGTTYHRGRVPQEELAQHAVLVPTEFMPGSLDSPLKDWLSQQPKTIQARFAQQASRRLEPLFRKLGAQRGLAISVNEGYGGYGGDGNANTQVTAVPLKGNWSEQQTQRAVKAFAADLGWAFRQDMAVMGHVVPPETPGSRMGYDIQLTRTLSPDEAATLGRAALRAMHVGLQGNINDVDAGYSLLPNNVVRFINYTDVSSHPMSDQEFANRVGAAVQHAVPQLIDHNADGSLTMRAIGWKGDASSNDWQTDPQGHGYDQDRLFGTSGTILAPGNRQNVEKLVSDIRATFDQFCAEFKAQQTPHEEAVLDEAAKSLPSGGPLLLLVKALPNIYFRIGMTKK